MRLAPIHPVRALAGYCMDAPADAPHHARVRVLPQIRRLDDCFGQFVVRVVSDCGACREIEPEAVARLVGWNNMNPSVSSRYGCAARGAGRKAAEVAAVARPRPR
jgi:hypothetical protein